MEKFGACWLPAASCLRIRTCWALASRLPFSCAGTSIRHGLARRAHQAVVSDMLHDERAPGMACSVGRLLLLHAHVPVCAHTAPCSGGPASALSEGSEVDCANVRPGPWNPDRQGGPGQNCRSVPACGDAVHHFTGNKANLSPCLWHSGTAEPERWAAVHQPHKQQSQRHVPLFVERTLWGNLCAISRRHAGHPACLQAQSQTGASKKS